MLKELNIKNLAIIDQLKVEFGPGMNVFTGETGAGKSIVVDALNLALGERASADLIRTGCDEAVVEAAFEVNGKGSDRIAAVLAEQGVEIKAGEDLIVRRTLSSSGKNKVYLNGGLSTLTTLAAAGSLLADIHGQHEHQSLLSLERQLDLLDSFGGHEKLRNEVAEEVRRMRELRERLAGLEAGERDRAQREELLRFQKDEIEAAALQSGEDEDLVALQKVMSNSEKLAAVSAMVDEMLYSSDDSVLANLAKAANGLKEIVAIDDRLAGAQELLESGRAHIEEAAREIASYRDLVEFDPVELERVGDRLDLIKTLKKKYGGSIEKVIEAGAAAAAELEQMDKNNDDMAGVSSQLESIRFEMTEKVHQLTRKRTAAAEDLKKKVEAELAQLGMKKTVFSVNIAQEAGEDTLDGLKVGQTGADRIEFLISPNPGEEPRSLAKIASGGELSRIMLALKTILIEGDSIPTLVFDEVDAGIGGMVAEEVGAKLRKIAKKRQVLCITHLPQIASVAASHFGVSKSVQKDRTTTGVRLLAGKDRVDEIARMLGGKTITDATMQHAHEMLERGSA